MHIIKWMLIFIAGLILFSLLTITPFAWLGLLIFLFELYQIIQRRKGKAIFLNPGRIMTIGFVISFIMSLIFVEPSSKVENVSEEIAINEAQTNEEVAVDKTQVSENEIAPGSQLEEDPTEDQVASKPELDVDATTPPPSPMKPGGNLSVHFLMLVDADQEVLVKERYTLDRIEKDTFVFLLKGDESQQLMVSKEK